MKVLAPLSAVKETDILLEEGAEEIYCGVMDNNIINKYELPILNARPRKRGNLKDIDSLVCVINKCHKRGVPVYVTFNSPIFTNKQMYMAKETIHNISGIGVDAIIVSDVGLMKWVSKNNFDFKIHISSLASCYNSWDVEFYKSLGASRVVLPRHMELVEMKEICNSHKDMEFEIFALNTLCVNDDGFCSYDHNIANCTEFKKYDCGGCGLEEGIKIYNKRNSGEKKLLYDFAYEYRRRKNIYKEACGACTITELVGDNIASLKIVGREYSLEKKILDLRFMMQVKKLINNSSEKNDIKIKVKEIYKENYNIDCRQKCYY